MSDKELLELAAKAAGIELLGRSYLLMEGTFIGFSVCGQELWNPLTDDGDALRLMVKLGMSIYINRLRIDGGDSPEVAVRYGGFFKDKKIEEWTGIEDDYYAATRRAIVRAAAEIGRTM